jgi:hypothetical protein
MHLPRDFEELLAAFDAEEVRYVLVGGYAVSLHSKPRATKDIDLWIDGGENLARVARALDHFGAPARIGRSDHSLTTSSCSWEAPRSASTSCGRSTA